MPQGVEKHVQAVEKLQRGFLLRGQELPLRAEAMPAILLLQILTPSHDPVAHFGQAQFLIEHRKIQRILVQVWPGKPAQSEDRICTLAPNIVVRVNVVAGLEGRQAAIQLFKRLRLELGNE